MAKVLIGILVLLVNFSSSASDRGLSDEDPRYEALKTIQEQICAGDTSHPCDTLTDTCTLLMTDLAEQIFPDDPEVDELIGSFSEICSVRATPYETPGTHWLLKQRVQAVAQIADSLGVGLGEEPIFGAVPFPSVNASIVPKFGQSPIILVNIHFFEFANELAKVVSGYTIPVNLDEGYYAIAIDVDASQQQIANSPVVRAHMIALLNYFLEGRKTSYLPPTDFSKTVQIVYTEGIETFAVAHEFGHLYHRHGSSANFDEELSLAVKELSVESSGLADMPLRLREIEADIYALRIVRAMAKDISVDDNPFYNAILHSVEFYFTARSILEEARAISSGRPVDTYEDGYGEDTKAIAACALSSGCSIVQYGSSLAILQQPNEHPPSGVRAEVVRRMIEQGGTPYDGQIIQIANLISRNAVLLWEAVKAEYVAQLSSDAQR